MRVWYIPTLDCSSQFASYYKAVRKEEVARRRSSCCKRVWTGLVEPVGKAGKAEAVVRERGGCRSVARGGGREEEAAVCWRCRSGGGRPRETGRWRRRWVRVRWWRKCTVDVQQYSRAQQAGEQQQQQQQRRAVV